jgi:hypothetical protein
MLTPSFFSPLRFTCKSPENKSGGTRTRTGDTMIFSPNSYVLACPVIRLIYAVFMAFLALAFLFCSALS